jgi:hypothetical protein
MDKKTIDIENRYKDMKNVYVPDVHKDNGYFN